MSQISRIIFGALAASLLGAVPFAVGQVAVGQVAVGQVVVGQEFAGRFEAAAEPAGTAINRATKADRAAGIPAAAAPTRTISMKVDSLTDTSILVRVPVAKEARNLPAAPVVTKPGEGKPNRKMAVACEPMVSVLTEVAKLLQPGRCVT